MPNAANWFRRYSGLVTESVSDSAQKLDDTAKGKAKGQSAQEWLDSQPKGTKTRIKDWLNSDLGARDNPWTDFGDPGTPNQSSDTLRDSIFSDAQRKQRANQQYDMADSARAENRKRKRAQEWEPSPDKAYESGKPRDPDPMTAWIQAYIDQQEEDYRHQETKFEAERKSPSELAAEKKAKAAQEKEKIDAEREEWRQQADKASEGWKDRSDKKRERISNERESWREQADTAAEKWKDNKAAQKLKDQAKQLKDAEDARSRAAKELAEANKLWWVSLESVGDEILNTASEAPISPGGGAASGSNIGRFFKRLKTSGGRLFNAMKGRRFNRTQFTNTRGLLGKGSGTARGAGKAAAGAAKAGRMAGAARGAATGARGGPWGAAAGAVIGAAVSGGGGKGDIKPGSPPGGDVAPGAGGGGSEGATGMLVFTNAIIIAGKATYDFARAQEEVVRKLAEVGPQQAASIAILDAKRIGRDIKTAQETGGSSQALTESLSKFEDALQPLEALLTNIANTMGAELIDLVTRQLEMMEPIIQAANAVYKWIMDEDIDNMNKGPETAWDFVKSLEADQEKSRAPMWPQGPTGTTPGAGSYSAQGYVSNRR